MKSIRISLKAKDEENIAYLLKQLNIESTQDLLRFLLTERTQAERSTQLRYGYQLNPQKEKKVEQEEKIAELFAMSDEDLTAYLVDIGYLEAPHEDSGQIFYEKVVTENGTRKLKGGSYNIANPEFTSFSDRMTWNELLNDLKKQKKL